MQSFSTIYLATMLIAHSTSSLAIRSRVCIIVGVIVIILYFDVLLLHIVLSLKEQLQGQRERYDRYNRCPLRTHAALPSQDGSLRCRFSSTMSFALLFFLILCSRVSWSTLLVVAYPNTRSLHNCYFQVCSVVSR